jgi:Phosphoadenosine phosphosulfate reductase family
MNILITNFGDPSLSLIIWLINQLQSNFQVISVDTHWQAPGWADRINTVTDYLARHNIAHQRLTAPMSFAALVRERRRFPSAKYQWCAAMLKGVPLNEYLDRIDPTCEATILMGKRRDSARLNQDLPEYIDASEYYNGRRVWHPLYQHDKAACDALLVGAGFTPLAHRSLECDPCIHNRASDFKRASQAVIDRCTELEKSIDRSMFEPADHNEASGFPAVCEHYQSIVESPKSDYNDHFSMGCGTPFGCGE